jgi:hypothetical protein
MRFNLFFFVTFATVIFKIYSMENNFQKKSGNTIRDFLKSGNFWKPVLGFTLGGLVGFLYYYFVGCTSGNCAITSNPLMSIVFGGVFGLLMVKSPCSRNRC